MILTAHLLLGAAIASKIEYAPAALFMAFLSHYFLDILPHIEYSISNISEKQWQKSAPDILSVFLDFFFGILLILIFSNNQPIIYMGAFVALIPDSLTIISSVFPNKILSKHDQLHRGKIHFLKYKKISIFWRISSQILAIIISIILLLS
ncbi:MAG: hypothetical protein HY005_03445 [Candidatus Staskawiczbacteria bacterium]|nr:hypothetical protein [Candidatus Staskawiczbacteria bacterium]MBI3337639.1 hypothetical protein [Candidatus Staskawiczbacteria bacterium]